MPPITYTPIGVIHSPFTELHGTPIQPRGGRGVEGTVEVFDEYVEGLADLDGFSHIYLLFHLHLSEGHKLKVIPYLDDKKRGLFSTRAPKRPNPIGLSVVQLLGVEGRILRIMDVDMIDGTPLLDIKPYVPEFERELGARIGWLTGKVEGASTKQDDGRFSD